MLTLNDKSGRFTPIIVNDVVGDTFLATMRQKEVDAEWPVEIIDLSEQKRRTKRMVIISPYGITVGNQGINSLTSYPQTFGLLAAMRGSWSTDNLANPYPTLFVSTFFAFMKLRFNVVFEGVEGETITTAQSRSDHGTLKIKGLANTSTLPDEKMYVVLSHYNSNGWTSHEFVTSNPWPGLVKGMNVKYQSGQWFVEAIVLSPNGYGLAKDCAPAFETITKKTSGAGFMVANDAEPTREYGFMYRFGTRLVGFANVLGGPEFALGWTIYTAEEIVESTTPGLFEFFVSEVCLDWEASLLKDMEIDAEARLKASALEGQVVRSSVFSRMRTVTGDLLAPLEIQAMAAQADTSIDDEQLFAVDTANNLPAMTFKQANRRAQGHQFATLHTFTISDEIIQRRLTEVASMTQVEKDILDDLYNAHDWERINNAGKDGLTLYATGEATDTTSWVIELRDGDEVITTNPTDIAVAWSDGAVLINNIDGKTDVDVITQYVGFKPPTFAQSTNVKREVSDFDEASFFRNRSVRPWELPVNQEAGFYLLHFARNRTQFTLPLSSFIIMGNQFFRNAKGLDITV